MLSKHDQVCIYCAKFLDHDYAESVVTETTAAAARKAVHIMEDVENNKNNGNKQVKHKRRSTGFLCWVKGEIVVGSEDDDGALDAVAREMKKNELIAQFEELKINTEIMLGVIWIVRERGRPILGTIEKE